MSIKNQVSPKVLIMAGGTGGHVFPALTIAEQLLSCGVQVEWLGTKNGIEATVIKDASIPLHFISVAGVRGKSLFKKLIAPFYIALAIIQSMLKILRIKPGCVLGMGGFVTGPGGIAAWLMRKELIIHEQNAIAGMTNHLLFPFASRRLEAFPNAFLRKKLITENKFLKSLIKTEKTEVVGNPVRKLIQGCVKTDDSSCDQGKAKTHLLVLGGSLGAQAINRIVPEMISLMKEDERPEVVHQCGKQHIKATLEAYKKAGLENSELINVQPFIKKMETMYSWADIVICRAGALTIAELATVGLPSVLVPFPYAVDDHQSANAQYLVDAGAAHLIHQKALTADVLLRAFRSISDSEQREKIALAAKSVASPQATEKIAAICMEACHV